MTTDSRPRAREAGPELLVISHWEAFVPTDASPELVEPLRRLVYHRRLLLRRPPPMLEVRRLPSLTSAAIVTVLSRPSATSSPGSVLVRELSAAQQTRGL